MARPGLTGHRKFRRLARALGSVIVARGALELLWEPSYETGDDYVGTTDDIEALVGWTGDRGVLTRALAEAGAPEGYGFIDPIDPTTVSTVREVLPLPIRHPLPAEAVYRIHDLWHHAPEYVKKRRERELDRQQKEAPKHERRRTADTGGHFDRSADQPRRLDRTLAPAPAPALAPAPAPLEEECAEPLRDSTPESTSPVFLEFPITGADGPTWRLREVQVAEWEQLYETLDVRQACRSALGWVKASPGRRKTKAGMARFLNGWCARAVNRGESLRDGRRPDDGRQTRPRGHVPYQPKYRAAWSCPHVEHCGSSSICANAIALKRPEKPGAVYERDEHGVPREVEAS